MEACKIVYRGGTGEIEEKKSRFIATIIPIASEEEAVAFIAATKKQYWDARHNCSAFVLGANQEITRCSDDGEPSGTAGRPMLGVLTQEGIHNMAVVVTRYFGGILLGTGGLVRAYQKAVSAGLSACTIIEKMAGWLLNINTDYNGIGKIQYLLSNEELPILNSNYEEAVTVQVVVPLERRIQVEELLVDATSGKAVLEWVKTVEYAVIDNQVKFF